MRPGLGVKEEGQPQTCKELLVPEKQFGSDCGPGGARGGILPTEGGGDSFFFFFSHANSLSVPNY